MQIYSLYSQSKDPKAESQDSQRIISAFNLVLVLNEQDPAFITYCKKSIIFFAKALELEEI